MIFVTVGTHEQQFNRVIKEVDNLLIQNKIQDQVIIQKGYSDYIPVKAEYKDMMSYYEMDLFYSKADIIITHGGPGSIFGAINKGKIPIVVPRNPDFDEHVDEHQIKFVKRLEENKKVIAVYDIKKLETYIKNYNEIIKTLQIDINSEKNKFLNKFSEYLNTIGGTNDVK